MVAGSIIKAIIILIGLLSSFILVLIGLIKKNNKKFKQAGIIFAGTCILVILVSAIEFLIIGYFLN